MLTIYDTTGQRLVPHGTKDPITKSTVWIDLLDPTREEDNLVEDLLKIDIPTRAEMREIEASSRIYQENGACYMTAYVVHEAADDGNGPQGSAITFILTGQVLVTVRYVDPKAFGLFRTRLNRGETSINHGATILIGLIEALIERQADFIEGVQDKVEKLAHKVFDFEGRKRKGEETLENVLRGIGAQGNIVARSQESTSTLDRVLHAFRNMSLDHGGDAKLIQRIETATRDIGSLTENLRFLSERVGFLLNATLGFISTEQNQIIKLFSVMAVMLMPPTLVASVYGMNFEHMPELKWQLGYPMALLAMVISAVVPFLYFRHKGWL